MNDLDDRLRTTLNELAGTVAPNPHARADLERRLARRLPRRPVLVAAAAAVVVAAVAIPVALNQSGAPTPGVPPSVTDSAEPRTTTTLPNGAGPIVLGRFDHYGASVAAVLSVTAMTDGEHWCIDVSGPVEDTLDLPGDCGVVPTWPANVPPGSVVVTHPVLGEQAPDSGPLPHLKLFMTSPQVTTLVVRRADGQPVSVNQLAATPGATFYLADFAGPTEGFGYTAKDAAGNVLEDAIT